jgi:serine/threonine-protein kinase
LRVVGKYKVIAKLGEGGMAQVHLAVVRGSVGMRKLVVLKSVRPRLLTENKACEMFLAEGRLAAALNHPNIVQTFEVVLAKKRPMMVMEYLDGQPLARILPLEALPLSISLFVFKEVLQGLEYAHNFTDLDGTSARLVHRDISPQNVFVTYDGQIKLLDFGIAKVLGGASAGHTETGEIKGKVRYMAPEQMLGSADLDPRADIFSLGVMLWEAVTRKRIWDGMPDVQVIRTVLHDGVPAPINVEPSVAPCLDAICRRAVAHDCNERYASAAAMHADLEAAIDALGLHTDGRQVGQFVADAFDGVRTSTRLAIEARLRDEKATSLAGIAPEDKDAIETLPALSGDRPSTESKRGPRKLRLGLFAVALAIPVAAALAVSSTHRPRLRDKVAPAIAESGPMAAIEPASESHDSSEKPAEPDRVFVETRAPLAMPAVTATKAPSRTAPSRAAPLPSASPPAPEPAPDPAASACDPPFVIDGNGIKRFKPGCLK